LIIREISQIFDASSAARVGARVDKLASKGQIGNADEAQAAALRDRHPLINRLVEIFNPLEALEVVVDDPKAGLVFLAVIAGLAAITFIAVGIWSAVQELFFGGGPPMGLGLK
jgi:hypothetical protein